MERSTVGSLLRTTQANCQQISEKHTFDFGIAYFSSQFASLPDANQIREAMVDHGDAAISAFEQAVSFFGSRGLMCLRWSPAVGVETGPLGDFLNKRGFSTRALCAFHLAHWPDTETHSEVRVLPARAVRDAFRQTFLLNDQPKGESDRGVLADSFAERLDDPQLDMFVATVRGKAAGRCGLYQVGDIARILDLSVLPAFANKGVDRALLLHSLAMAKRLTMPMVVAQALATDGARRELLTSMGFVEDGRVMEYETPSPFSLVPPA